MKTALERANELFSMRYLEVPDKAKAFLSKMVCETGSCSEVFIYSYAIYAQCIENLPCDDSSFKAEQSHYDFFNSL